MAWIGLVRVLQHDHCSNRARKTEYAGAPTALAGPCQRAAAAGGVAGAVAGAGAGAVAGPVAGRGRRLRVGVAAGWVVDAGVPAGATTDCVVGCVDARARRRRVGWVVGALLP